MKIARLIGSAGSGKTTELLRIMEAALPKLGNDPLRLGFASFTRAARAEAVSRAAAAWNVSPSLLDRDGWFRTIHSTAKRCLAIPAGQLIGASSKDHEWISNAIGVQVSTSIDEDTGRQKFIGGAAGAALEAWNLARNTLQPLDIVVRRARQRDDNVPDYAAVVRIAERYEMEKRVEDRLDFTDLLLRFAGFSVSPVRGVEVVAPEGILPQVTAWIFDEQQDASPLLDAACKRLVSAESVMWCYAAGDPFQCQPAGTPVLTATGYKPIEELNPQDDWLIAFCKSDGKFYGTGGGVRFKKAWRDVDSGDLFEVRFSDGTTSVCTSNHRWLVRTNRREAYATYLMRKGARWRIGTVQMFANGSPKTTNKNGDFRLKMRMNQEDADAVWILRVSDTDREARMYEQIASCRFGIPQVTFRPPCGCKNNLDAEFIDTVFNDLGDLTVNGLRCLAAHDLEVAFPFTTKADRSKNGSKACRFIQVPNLLPGIHVVPKLKEGFLQRRKRGSGNPRGARTIGKEVEWVGVEHVRRLSPGETVRVYSLEVEKHHTYVTTNGIVTGNCIFGFAGSASDCFLGWPADKERIMPKSYRCPKPILELGEVCLRRMHRGYFDRKVAPADHEGRVYESDIELPVTRARPDEDWLFIARTNFEAARLYASLNAAGKPAKWVKQPDGITARGEGLAALYALEKGQHVSGADWARAIALLPPLDKSRQPILARGVKTNWGAKHAADWDVIFPSDLPNVGATESLIQKISTGQWVGLVNRGEEWRRHAERWGPELAANTRIRVGTIHCSPPDEPVFTTDGYVPIGELDPKRHFLCAFDRKAVRFVLGRRGRGTGSYIGAGYTFKKCWRPYEGTLFTLTTDRSSTKVTPEHRVTVRYAESFFNKHIVYLMRKGQCWRIGIATSAYRQPYVSGGLNGRLATEDADAGWILSVHENREEAMFQEAVVQAKYGISGMRFRATSNSSTLDSNRLMDAHELAAPFVASRVAMLMSDYGLVFDMPLYCRDGKVRSDRSFDTAAGNVLSAYMEMATARDSFISRRCARDSDDAAPIWLPCKKTSEHYSGPVFSIDVAPHHHYISGGAAVHNSVKGMEADNVALLTTVGKRVAEGMDDAEQHDEECRIAYVGVTRARRNLYVINESQRGKTVRCMEVL